MRLAHKNLPSIFTAICLLVTPVHAQVLEGRAEVVDGDTISIQGVEESIRLFGIDAPESQQTCEIGGEKYLCGSFAAQALAELVGRNGYVRCDVQDVDRYGRYVAICSSTEGYELNGSMVLSGWALDYSRYSGHRYAEDQSLAKHSSRGIWQGTFVAPWDWRQGERLDAPESPDGCQIKGNISGSGRIYHVPGGYYYGRTIIDESAGERFFCSEQEAQQAGWRKSQR